MCLTLKQLDISFNQLQSILPILSSLSFGTHGALQHLRFNDNPLMANRYNKIEGYVNRLFPSLKEINNLYVNQLKCDTEYPVPMDLGCLSMFDKKEELSNSRKTYSELINLLTLHQSEKLFIQKRINSKILIGKCFDLKIQTSYTPQNTRITSTKCYP